MAGKKIFTTEQRFWARVLKTEACWLWQRVSRGGYGQMNIDRKLIGAHRYSWELHYGPIPEGLWVLHKCDNRACVRPDHLFVGTPKDNVDDMWAKGRVKFNPRLGSDNGMAKLKEEDVKLLLDLHKRKIPHRVIARILKTTRSNVSIIAAGRGWKHLHGKNTSS